MLQMRLQVGAQQECQSGQCQDLPFLQIQEMERVTEGGRVFQMRIAVYPEEKGGDMSQMFRISGICRMHMRILRHNLGNQGCWETHLPKVRADSVGRRGCIGESDVSL